MAVQSNIVSKGCFDIKKFRMAAVLSVLFVFFTSISNTGLNGAAIWAYATPLVFAAAGITFYTGEYFSKKRYIAFMMYGVWFVICRWLCGDFFMMLSDQLAFAMLAYVLLLALPFARIMDDTEKRNYLDIISWITVAVFAVVFALIYIGHFRGRDVVIVEHFLEFGSEIRNGSLFIKMCHTDDYPTDYIACGCFLICLYLVVSSWHRKKILSVLAALLSVFFCIAVVLIPCRTVLVAVCGALLLILLIFLQRLKISKKLVWAIFGLCCTAGAAFVLFGSDSVYSAVANNGRSALGRLSEFSGRKGVWSAAFKILRDEPIALLYGFSLDGVMTKILEYDTQGLGHMHNGFMEALVLTGIPGALAAVAFSVKLIISSVKVFFSGKITVAYKMMAVALAAIFFMNIFDSIIFINRTNTDVVHFFFALFAGYLFEAEEKWCSKKSEIKQEETITA